MQYFNLTLPLPKTWLITGVAGFIGSNLLDYLLKKDQTVIGLDNLLTGKKHNLEEVLAPLPENQRKNFRFIEGDIRNFDTCFAATKGVDYVLHQAALGSIPRSLNDPLTTNAVNVEGTLNMLRAADQNKVSRFVFASSSSVYGDSPDLPKVEDRVGNPLSPYATSKRACEFYGQVFHRCYNLPTIGLRYFNVFGPRQDPTSVYAAVIPLWTAALLNNQPCYVNGDGSNSRDFCFVENVVQANIRAALTENTQSFGEIFNIAFGQRATLLELHTLLKRALGLDDAPTPLHREARLGDMKHSLASIDKAKTLLGYDPHYSLEDGLKITAAWARQHY